MLSDSMRRPARSEAAEYYFTYIDRVPDTDIVPLLSAQRDEAVQLLRGIPDAMADHRYAPGKWTLREVAGHLNDTERVFAARAFWFARGFDGALPGYDQNIAVAAGEFGDRTWSSLIDEFSTIRAATVSLFGNLSAEAWDRSGIASERPFTVRALAFIAAGHLIHHMDIVKTKYLAGPGA